jgi:hypothetical protein
VSGKTLPFDGGFIEWITHDRVRIQTETEHWEMNFVNLIQRLRHDHLSKDRLTIAAMAMQGIIASSDELMSTDDISKKSVMMADELLKELTK